MISPGRLVGIGIALLVLAGTVPIGAPSGRNVKVLLEVRQQTQAGR